MLQSSDRFLFEKSLMAEGFQAIAGVDEAGRGPLAGPVVAAAVILPDKFGLEEVNDSKKLSAKKRGRLAGEICRQCVVGIGIATAAVVDDVNIRNASLRAMSKAVFSLKKKPDCLLVDGNAAIDCGIYEKTIVKGDARSLSIGAASIIAKEFRDIIMRDYALEYPQYLFEKHKGYPTRKHKELIAIYGLSPVHRKTFNYKQKSK